MKKRTKLIFSLMVILMPCITYSQVVNLIPSEHLDNDVAGVLNSWSNSGTHAFDKPLYVAKQIDVTESGYNIFSNGVACGEEINKLITELNPPPSINNIVMLYFPPGVYLIDENISLPGYIILKGAGGDFELPQQTHFHFNLGTDYGHPCISMSGEMNGVEDIYIVDDTPSSIQVTSIPTSFINGALYYGVTGATAMYTNVAETCSGSGTVTNNQGIFFCGASLKPGISYSVTTTFSNSLENITVTHTVFAVGSKSISSNDDFLPTEELLTQNKPDSLKSKTPDLYFQYTINITGDNNWVRGVESGNTRRFHVYIDGGKHNTISGCYFHHAVDYSDNSGRGYGVCLSGTDTKFNRIEDNIFEHLRHSMVLQGDAERNVFGYNYSFDIHATRGNPLYAEADLLLHGRPSNTYEHGPKTNLLEGNYVERVRVDWVDTKKKLPNGPYNTFFRNYSILNFFKITKAEDYKSEQYKQNVIGSQLEPIGSTKHRIKKQGFSKYWIDDPNYMNIPDMYASYYYDSKPDFYFQSLPWPLKPWVFQPPATVRCNMGLTRPVYAGWGSYDNLCGPPNYKFYGKLWQNSNEEYRAMDNIELSLSYVIENSYLTLRAGNSVLLKPGFKVMEGNNHVIIKAGDVCGDKQNPASKNSIYDNISYVGLFDENGKNDTLTKSSETDLLTSSNQNKEQTENGFHIFPNPNNGEFFINSNFTIAKNEIHIYSLLGNTLQFKLTEDRGLSRIVLINSHCGIVLVKFQNNNISKVQKLLVK